MKTFLFDTFNRYKRYSENLDVKTTLCNKTWCVFNNSGEKEVCIFEEDGGLIVSINGSVTNAKWKYIPANKSLIISSDKKNGMYQPAFIDNVIFSLQLDGTNNYAFLIDEANKDNFQPKTLIDIENYFSKKELAIKNQEKRQKALLVANERAMEEAHLLKIRKERADEVERERKSQKVQKILSTDPHYLKLNLKLHFLDKRLKSIKVFILLCLFIVCFLIIISIISQSNFFVLLTLIAFLGMLIFTFWALICHRIGEETMTKLSEYRQMITNKV